MAMPIVVMRARDFDLVGNERKETLEANDSLKKRLESIRLQAGYLMNLGDVSQQTIPKMCLVSAPENKVVLSILVCLFRTLYTKLLAF